MSVYSIIAEAARLQRASTAMARCKKRNSNDGISSLVLHVPVHVFLLLRITFGWGIVDGRFSISISVRVWYFLYFMISM